MSVRVCQFCEKPLSRLRVGGDGDFCSKEHRNQFRLRAGMDRLVEVNKVASLMRRRENARQIAPASLICNAALGRRGFLDAQPARIDSNPRLIALRPTALARPRITAYSDRCVQRRLSPTNGALPSSRAHDGVVRIVARNSIPAGAAAAVPRSHRIPAESAQPRCAPSPSKVCARIAISRSCRPPESARTWAPVRDRCASRNAPHSLPPRVLIRFRRTRWRAMRYASRSASPFVFRRCNNSSAGRLCTCRPRSARWTSRGR